MATGATVYKALIDISDLDRNYYGSHSLTVARHPSETEERLMLRILAFCCHAGEHLEFGRGLSTQGEPALWEMAPTGEIHHWIEVGCVDVKQVRRACGKSEMVTIMAYDDDRIVPWWTSNKGEFSKLDKLSVITVSNELLEKLAKYVNRNMRLSVTIQDNIIWLSDDSGSLQIEFQTLKHRNQSVY